MMWYQVGVYDMGYIKQMRGKKQEKELNHKHKPQQLEIFQDHQSHIQGQEPQFNCQHFQRFPTNHSLLPRKVQSVQTIKKIPIAHIQTSKPCLNHNFQKHAVVTIKKLFNFQPQLFRNDTQRAAHIMWSIFKSSPIKTKKTINIIFGKAQITNQAYSEMLQSCGFGQLLQYDEDLIRKAQDYLRNRFVQCVSELDLRESLRTIRRIKMSEQFVVYFMEMVEQLKRGPLVKLRINDSTAKKIQAKIESNREWLQQFPVG